MSKRQRRNRGGDPDEPTQSVSPPTSEVEKGEKMTEQRRYVPEHMATIKVIGIGGGGCNAVNRMVDSGIKGAEFFAVNTDVKALKSTRTDNTVQIGQNLTRGLVGGGAPELGRHA